MFPNNTTTWNETNFLNWSLLVISNKVLYKLLHVPSVYSIVSNLADNKRICELLGFLIRVTEVSSLLGCDAMSQSSDGDRGTLRHILEERRPQHKQSLQTLKFVVTKCATLPFSGASPEHSSTALRPWSQQHNYSCVLQRIPEHLQISTYTSQKQTTWNMKAEIITAYFVLRQTPLARMTADGNKRSEI
jgi:hypothetical protein